MKMALKYKNMDTGVNCILSSVSNIISNYDNTIDDSVIFFLENGFNINYCKDDAKSIKDIKIESNITKLAGLFLEKRGINYKYSCLQYICNINQIKSFIQENVKNANPVLTVVNTSKLSYNSVYTTNPGREHVICFTGFDGDGLIFSDCYVPTTHSSTYQGVMSVSMLNEAWKSTGWKYINIDYSKIRNIHFNITEEMLRESININLNRYLFGNAGMRDIDKLYTFAYDISEFTVLFSEEDIKLNIKDLSYKIQFEGILPALFLLKKALLKFNTRGKYRINEGLIDKLDTILERWRRITLMLVKAGFRISNNSFKNISNYVKETVDFEVELINNILNVLI